MTCRFVARVKQVLGDLSRRLIVLTLLLHGTWTAIGSCAVLLECVRTPVSRAATRLNVGNMKLLNRTL